MTEPSEPFALPYLTTQYTVAVEETLRLPAFSGTAIRGALGESLRSEVCTTGAPKCEDCPLLSTCAFGVIWEGGANVELPKRFDSPPRPYIFVPPIFAAPQTFKKYATFRFGLTLLGSAVEHAPLLTEAASSISALGQGHGRSLVQVRRLEGLRGLLTYSPTNSDGPLNIKLELESPLQLKADGQTLEHFDPVAFTDRLVARVELLGSAYGTGEGLPHRRFQDLSKYVQLVKAELVPHHFERRSRRQDRKVPMMGFSGEVFLKNVHPDLLQLWKLGEVVHVGKQATFGFGRIRIQEFDNA